MRGPRSDELLVGSKREPCSRFSSCGCARSTASQRRGGGAECGGCGREIDSIDLVPNGRQLNASGPGIGFLLAAERGVVARRTR